MAKALVLLRTTPDTLLERVGQLSRNQRGFRLAVISAACAHAGLVSMLSDARTADDSKAWSEPASELVIELPAPERPEPSAEEPAAMTDTQPARAPLAQRPTPTSAASPAARAGAVLSRSEDSEQPLDFTDSIVTGTAVSYAGGITQAQGTSQHAVRAVADGAAPNARGPSAGSAASTPGRDLSRGPAVLGGLAWNCPFPPAADADSVDHAQVAIRVEVEASGRPARVLILSDPGHGFAAAARACALGKRWTPGADRAGRPTASGLNINVRFVR
jgi:protein TonB